MMRERTRGKTSRFARAAVAAALVVPLAVVAAACNDAATAANQSPPPVRIGAIYDLSGERAALDVASLEGARLAVDRINARGGLMGRRVELLERDGQTRQADVQRAAASLVASGCSAIIGLSDADEVLAAAPIAARAGVPFVTSGATSPKLVKQVPNWLFLACFGDNAQAAAAAQYASEQLGARTATVLYDPDAQSSRQLAQYFERSFRAQGGTVLAAWPTKPGWDRLHAAYRTAAASAEKARREAATGGLPRSPAESDVLYVAVPPDSAPTAVRRLRSMGARQPIIGGDSYDTSELIGAAEQTGGKVYYTTHAGIEMSDASRAVRRFDTSYQAAYGQPPQNASAALGFDAVDLVAEAIKRADSVKPSKVRDALLKTRHFPGVTGTLSYMGGDRLPRKKVTVVCVGRRPVVVSQFTPGYVSKP
ncbi:MAG TPA: ABC transporter substrate-binding protein [Thermoleophilia bacterium]|nr:ABC transporter substrate-binding protein [Thermoleophilia bacterium]